MEKQSFLLSFEFVMPKECNANNHNKKGLAFLRKLVFAIFLLLLLLLLLLFLQLDSEQDSVV